MAAPPIPPASLTPALLVAVMLASNATVLRLLKQGLPTSPDGLNPGDAWSNGDSISFVPTPPAS
jgi:hypothetical protein